jgi:hypothetical protein
MGAEREVIFEFVRIGTAMKIIAVDAETGVEATVVGDPKAAPETLRRLARQKLDYVMRKRA